MTKKFAAYLTMCYDDWDNLAVWVDHTSSTLPNGDLFILDHGSSTPVSDVLEGRNNITVERVERADGQTQAWRANTISERVEQLLDTYENVIYTDCDELLVPDPAKFSSLQDFLEKYPHDYVTALGFDVVHDASSEQGYVGGKFSRIRSHVQLAMAMCKPVLAKQKGLRWIAGFHTCNRKPCFGGLYLFHLRYADMDLSRKRLNITRNIERADPKPEGIVDHWKISDETLKYWVTSWLAMPRVVSTLREDDPFVVEYLKDFVENSKEGDDGIWYVDYSVRGKEILYLPSDFVDSF